MGKTSIEWTDHSINPIRARLKSTGAVGHYCEKISTGCVHCYASGLQRRFQMPEFGGGQKRDDIELFLDNKKLEEVRRRKKPTRYFWCDMTDLFGDWVQDEWIDACFDTMWLTPRHTHQILTKRPDRMVRYVRERASRQCFGWTDIDRRPMKPNDIVHLDTLQYRNECGFACGDWGCDHPSNDSKGEDGSCHKYECPIAECVSDRESLHRAGFSDDFEFDDDGLTDSSEWMQFAR